MATEFNNDNNSNSQQGAGAYQSSESFAPQTETGALIPGTFELISELQRRLGNGESFNNPKLTSVASEYFGGGRMEGKYSPKDAYDALEVAVNRLLLEGDARALMEMGGPALGLNHILFPLLKQLPRQDDRTLEQQLLQQFSTPPTLAFVAARTLNPNESDILIEPSAGTASLAIWGQAVGATVITNEISPRRRALLELLGFSTMAIDAEYLDDLLPGEIKPTVALMNPPFSATGGRVARNNTFYGARHFETTLKRIELGGRLVGISGQGMGLDKPAFAAWWRDIAAKYTVRANLSMPGENYARYGTTFDNQLIVIDKTGPTPGRTWDEQLRHIRYGEMETLEHGLKILAPIAADRPEKGEIRTKPSSILIFNPQPAELPEEEERAEVEETKPVEAAPAVEPQETPAPPAPSQPPVISVTPDDEDEAIKALDNDFENDEVENDAVVFVPYKPAMLTGGVPHPADIVEAASMGAITPPAITYRPHLPGRIISEGLLSDVQLERVVYAGQAHEQRLPNGARGGFFVGDGTGVGKGRILAGIIVDNWFQGRRRALWLSVNNDLMDSALRDLTDLGVRVPLARINDYLATQDITLPEGVIFSSYSSLISSAKSGERRFDQVQKWLGNDGVIIFDESHKAKNALASGRGEPTQTGQAVIDLQGTGRNPDYRIVYSSATGATDVRNCVYLTR